MTGVDTRSERGVCLKVTSDYARHAAEVQLRRRLAAEFVVEMFDSMEDTLGNYTTVLGAQIFAAGLSAASLDCDRLCSMCFLPL